MKEVHVECYEGTRADERPRRVTIDGVTYTVARVLDQSVSEDRVTRERSYRYRILTEDGLVINLVRDGAGEWHAALG